MPEALHILRRLFFADKDDHRGEQANIYYTRAKYSNCGSFCFLRTGDGETLDLHSNFLEKMQASIRLPAVWEHTLYNGRSYSVARRNGPAMVKMYLDGKVPGGIRRDTAREIIPSEVNITAFPNHLASATIYLLSSKDGDDFVRILFLPDTRRENSGPPEIKFLRVTLNQILAKLEETAKIALEEHKNATTEAVEADASGDSQEISSD